MSEICSNLTIKTPEQRHRRHSGVFIVKFQHISCIAPVSPLLTLTMKLTMKLLKTGTYRKVIRKKCVIRKKMCNEKACTCKYIGTIRK